MVINRFELMNKIEELKTQLSNHRDVSFRLGADYAIGEIKKLLTPDPRPHDRGGIGAGRFEELNAEITGEKP